MPLAASELGAERLEGERGHRHRWRLAVAVIVTIAALVPAAAALAIHAGRSFTPVGDSAIFDLRVHDVWPLGPLTPLTGAYSRMGWSHPGPLLYWLEAPLSAIGGGSSWATLCAQVALEALAVALTARLAWSTGGLRRVLPWVAVQATVAAALGSQQLLVLWNPNVALPFFVLFLLQAWVVAQGASRHLPGLTVVGLLLVEAHVGYTLVVVTGGIWAVICLVRAERRAGRPAMAIRPWSMSGIAVGVLFLIPVALDAVRRPPGNFVHLINAALGMEPGSKLPLVGLRSGLGLMATEFRWRPPWLGGVDPVDPFSGGPHPSGMGWLLVGVMLLTSAWLIVRRGGRRDLCLLVELLALVATAGVLAISSVRGAPLAYLFSWRVALGAGICILGTAAAGEVLTMQHTRALQWGAAGLLALTVAASASLTTAVVTTPSGVLPMAPVAAALATQINDQHPPTSPTLLRVAGTPLGGLHAALVDQLARAGRPLGVDPGLGPAFGWSRVKAPTQVATEWLVSEDTITTLTIEALPGAEVVAATHPLPPRDEARLRTLVTMLSDQLVAAGRADAVPELASPLAPFALAAVPGLSQTSLYELARLDVVISRRTCLCAVVAVPPGEGPGPPPSP